MFAKLVPSDFVNRRKYYYTPGIWFERPKPKSGWKGSIALYFPANSKIERIKFWLTGPPFGDQKWLEVRKRPVCERTNCWEFATHSDSDIWIDTEGTEWTRYYEVCAKHSTPRWSTR